MNFLGVTTNMTLDLKDRLEMNLTSTVDDQDTAMDNLGSYKGGSTTLLQWGPEKNISSSSCEQTFPHEHQVGGQSSFCWFPHLVPSFFLVFLHGLLAMASPKVHMHFTRRNLCGLTDDPNPGLIIGICHGSSPSSSTTMSLN